MQETLFQVAKHQEHFFLRKMTGLHHTQSQSGDATTIFYQHNPNIQISQIPNIQNSRYPNIQISQNLDVPKIQTSKKSRYPDIQRSRYPNIQISRCPDIQISRCLDIQLSKIPNQGHAGLMLPESPKSLNPRSRIFNSHNPSKLQLRKKCDSD